MTATSKNAIIINVNKQNTQHKREEKVTKMTDKMTKREKFQMLASIPAVKENEMLTDFIAHEIELLSRKRSKSSAPTKKQIENDALKERIAGVLTAEKQSPSDIAKSLGESLSSQKVTAQLIRLVREGTATREKVKGKVFYSANC